MLMVFKQQGSHNVRDESGDGGASIVPLDRGNNLEL